MQEQKYRQLADLLVRAIDPRITQEELGAWCGTGQAAVSKWLTGISRPSPSNLVRLSLHPKVRLDLENLVVVGHYDRDKVWGFLRGRQPTPADIVHTKDTLASINHVRLEGNPNQAIELGRSAEQWVTHLLREASSGALTESLNHTRFFLLTELAIAYREITSGNSLLLFTAPIVQQQFQLAEDMDDEELFGLSYLSKSDDYYCAGMHLRSLEYAGRGLEIVQTPDERLLGLRVKMITSSLLNKKRLAIATIRAAEDVIDGGQWTRDDVVCEALEGIALSFANLGLAEQSYKAIERNETLLAAMKMDGRDSPIRFIQHIRSKLRITEKFNPRDLVLIESQGNKALTAATAANKYPRHAEQLSKILNSLLA